MVDPNDLLAKLPNKFSLEQAKEVFGKKYKIILAVLYGSGYIDTNEDQTEFIKL